MRKRTRVKRSRTGSSKRGLRLGRSKARRKGLPRKALSKLTAKAQHNNPPPGAEQTEASNGAIYDQGFDTGHATGYKEGLEAGEKLGRQQGTGCDEAREAGFQQGYVKGFKEGKHTGGDGIVDLVLPAYQIMPEAGIEEIVAAGVNALSHRIVHLLTVQEVGERIMNALESHSPFSLVRLGDGESLTLAQDTVMTAEQVREAGDFLQYAGVSVPDHAARDSLASAIRRATVVGVPKLRQPNYQPLTFAAFRANGIDYQKLALTDSLINYYIHQSGYLSRMMQGRRVLLIGDKGMELANVLSANGVNVAGVIAPVQGVGDAGRVSELAEGYDFDLAIVSAGISAVLIAENIATRIGKVAVDFGHMADALIKGEAAFR